MYRKFVEKNSNNNILSAVDVLGRFDFGTCLISLDSLDTNDLERLAKSHTKGEKPTDDVLFGLRKVLPLAIHEYTHFIDSTSTVWGIDHLHMMNSAYESDDRRGGTEEGFYVAKQFSDHLNRIKYPNYYTVVNNIEDKQPWVAQPSIGQLFGADGKPSDESILFIRFTRSDGELIARSPISPVSILEASAMAQEVLSEGMMINEHSDDCKIIESINFSKRTLSFLYNKNVTEYSACIHMLANQQGCSDIGQAFMLVSLITRIVLNSTEAAFETVIKNDSFNQVLGKSLDDGMLVGIKNGLRHNNIGILYYLIVSGLPEKSYLSIGSAKKGIEDSLKILGLSVEYINETALRHFEEIEKFISNTKIEPIKKIASSAKNNFSKIDIQAVAIPFDKLGLPKVMLGDLTESFIFPPDNNELKNFDIESCFDELAFGESWVKRFNEGCV
ncbi:MAG: hypothetical protein ACJAW0_000537 [Zhongshania sp.]|jgi:hypothetical protein